MVFTLGIFQPGLLCAQDPGRAGLKRPNILMIAIDTCRADHFSVYGYERSTTPNMDRLARRGVLFESAYAQTNWTLPSFASLLTGKYPRRLGMFEEGKRLTKFDYIDPKLSDAETTLPEALKKAGYRTAGFFTGRFNGPAYGFGQGFDLYRDYTSNSDMEKGSKNSFASFLPEAYKWMEKKSSAPFFIIFNPFELHRPYLPPAEFLKPYAGSYKGVLAYTRLSKPVLSGITKDERGWSFSPDNKADDEDSSPKAEPPAAKGPPVRLGQADIDYIVARYDASLGYVDNLIGELVERVSRETRDNTIIILTADHGEGLGDHGGFLHCTNPPRLYEELVHVPLMIYVPEKWLKAGVAVVKQPVELTDLMPTILDLAKIPKPPPGMQGKSLVGVITGKTKEGTDRPVFAETAGYGFHLRSVKAGSWKLIRVETMNGAAPRTELYDLASDPAEAHDLAAQNPDIAGKLLDRLNAWNAENEN